MTGVAVQLECGCWTSSSQGELVAGNRLQVACLRHNVQPVITRPDILEVVVSELQSPTGAVPREAAWM